MSTVHVLGAGFSLPAGVPVQEHILRAALETPIEDLELEANRLEAQTFVAEWAGHDSYVEVALEDLFTFLDTEILELVAWRGYSVERLFGIRRSLERLAAHAVLASQFTAPTTSDLYKAIVSKLWQSSGDVVISLNWDTVVETCTGDDWTLAFDGLHHDQRSLLKLHGSADWMMCVHCNHAWRVAQGESQCGGCGRCDLRTLMLTPSLYKVRPSRLQLVWDQAFRTLNLADRVVFVGYSLPVADHDLKQLFKRALRPGCTVEVVLLSSTTDFREVARRYRTLFGASVASVYESGTERYYMDLPNLGAP